MTKKFIPPYSIWIRFTTFIVIRDHDNFVPVDISVSFYEAVPHSFVWKVSNDGYVPIAVCSGNSFWADAFLIVLN